MNQMLNRLADIEPTTAAYVGAGIGLTGSALLFATVEAYRNYIIWAWTNPWLQALALLTIVLNIYVYFKTK